jgi:hypothetical protein
MKVLEHVVQSVDFNKTTLEEVMAKEKKFEAVADRVGGFPPKLRYFTYYGKDNPYTFFWDRIWNNLAEMEAAYAKLRQQPEMAEIRKMPPEFTPVSQELFIIVED